MTGEIIGYADSLRFPQNNVVLNPARKFSLPYACAEVLWYLRGTTDISMIKFYAPQYERFAEDGHAYGAYGHRWQYSRSFCEEGMNTQCIQRDQISAVIELLAAKPDSRQAIVSMWESGDLIHAIAGDHKDLPCTIALQFLVRNNWLHLVATMRSNDVWLGLPYDVFAFTTIQAIVANELRLGLGCYHHRSGSEHLYARNHEQAVTAVLDDSYACCYPGVAHLKKEGSSVIDGLVYALHLEELARLNQWNDGKLLHELEHANLHPILFNLVLGCAAKWTAFDPGCFTNPLYRALMERYYNEAGYSTRSRHSG